MSVLFARIDLGLTAIVFVAFGFWGLLAPANMISNVGLAFTNGGGAVAIRGMYGGFLLGAGLLFGISALKPDMAHFGLIALAVIVGSILGVAGLWHDRRAYISDNPVELRTDRNDVFRCDHGFARQR